MNKFNSILLIQICFVSLTHAQISSMDFPYSYALQGKSGYKERFSPELYDESEKVKVVLEGLEDSLRTSVRRLTSSYDQYQYLIFDNFYYQAGQIKNEVNVQSVYFDGERKQSGDWGLVGKSRLSNGNILILASIQHVSKSITYIYRFLIFDKTGKNLVGRNDYCFLDEPKVLPEINGGFSIVIGRDYTPLLIENYVLAGNEKVEKFANVYRQSTPAVSITRFDNEAKVVKKNSYLLHEDSNIKQDKILDVINDSKYNYVLLISNMSGVVNQPTLAALIVQRDRPSVFEIENLYEINPNRADDKTRLEKRNGKVYAFLPLADEGTEIKSRPKSNREPLSATSDLKNTSQKSEREQGQEILSKFSIENQCQGYISTPGGVFLSTRSKENKQVNFFYSAESINEVESLKDYLIAGYIPSKNILIVNYADRKFSDVMSSTVSSYNLTTKQFKLLANYGINGYSGIYRTRVNGESVVCTVNKKRKNEVGSDLVEETISIE